jgi:hypothetical protein
MVRSPGVFDADDAARIGPRGEPGQGGIGPLRIKAQPIDHPLIGIEPEHPWPWVAHLW